MIIEKREKEIITLSISVFLIFLNLFYFFSLYEMTNSTVAYSIGGIIIGMCLADFCGGFVHWAADTWFTIELPLLGPK